MKYPLISQERKVFTLSPTDAYFGRQSIPAVYGVYGKIVVNENERLA